MVHLTLFTAFLTAIQSFYSYSGVLSVGDADYQRHIFTEYGIQVDYDLETPNQNQFGYNYYTDGSGNEYLIQQGNFVLASNDNGDNENEYGAYRFHCEIPEELRNTTDFPLADNNGSWTLFDFNLFKDVDGDYNNNLVCSYYPNIKNFLFNVTFHLRFDIIYVDYTDHADELVFDNRYGFEYDIPMYVQDYGGETIWSLSSYLSTELNTVLSYDAYICLWSVTFTMEDYQTVYQQAYNNGYLDGKNDGVILGGNTSFTKLLSNIADIPILILRKLFGYDVLGVNIYGALATIMSLVVALAIFRFIRGVF